jgi:hypothetical protein
VVAVLSATWLWYFSTLVLVMIESTGLPKSDLGQLFTPMQAPALQTSGQRWVGKPELPEVAQPRLAAILLQYAESHSPLAQRSAVYAKVVQVISATLLAFHQADTQEGDAGADAARKDHQQSLAKEARAPRDTLRAAFPGAEKTLQQMSDEWHAGKIHVHIVPEQLLRLSDDYVYAAAAVNTEAALKIFVASDKLDEKEQEKTYALPRQIAEAMLHEYVEQRLQWRHRDACLAELLLLEESDLVPARVSLQLAAVGMCSYCLLLSSSDVFPPQMTKD